MLLEKYKNKKASRRVRGESETDTCVQSTYPASDQHIQRNPATAAIRSRDVYGKSSRRNEETINYEPAAPNALSLRESYLITDVLVSRDHLGIEMSNIINDCENISLDFKLIFGSQFSNIHVNGSSL